MARGTKKTSAKGVAKKDKVIDKSEDKKDEKNIAGTDESALLRDAQKDDEPTGTSVPDMIHQTRLRNMKNKTTKKKRIVRVEKPEEDEDGDAGN